MLRNLVVILFLITPIKTIELVDNNTAQQEPKIKRAFNYPANFLTSGRLVPKTRKMTRIKKMHDGNSSFACMQDNYRDSTEVLATNVIHCSRFFEKLTKPKRVRNKNWAESRIYKYSRDFNDRINPVAAQGAAAHPQYRAKRSLTFETYYQQHPPKRNNRKSFISNSRRIANNRIRHQMQSSFQRGRSNRGAPTSFNSLNPSYLSKVPRRAHDEPPLDPLTKRTPAKGGDENTDFHPPSFNNKKEGDKYKDIYLREGFITYQKNAKAEDPAAGVADVDYHNVSAPPILPTAMPLQSTAPNITWGRAQTHTASFTDPDPLDITSRDGEQARLPCSVLHLGHGEVSWIRKRDLHILTVGRTTYTSDQRFRVLHGEGSLDWTLIIGPTTLRDAGIYECQVSTKPKISRPVNLIIAVERAEIQGPSEVFIRNGSTISLTCVVKSKSENLGSVVWTKEGVVLDYDSQRGGISLEVERTPTKSTTKLFITKARKSDSGAYVCSPQFAQPASVVVHVVNGEESAAVQTSESIHLKSSNNLILSSLFLLITFSCSLLLPYTPLSFFTLCYKNVKFFCWSIIYLCKYLFYLNAFSFLFTKKKLFLGRNFPNSFLFAVCVFFNINSRAFFLLAFLSLGIMRSVFKFSSAFFYRRVFPCSLQETFCLEKGNDLLSSEKELIDQLMR